MSSDLERNHGYCVKSFNNVWMIIKIREFVNKKKCFNFLREKLLSMCNNEAMHCNARERVKKCEK